jgi:hypothetical protein
MATPSPAVSFTDIQQDVQKVRQTLSDLKGILDQLNKPRSVVCIVNNVTDEPLTFSSGTNDHGGFATSPPPVINARSAAAFGAQSSSGALFTGTEGRVRYAGPDGMGVTFHWDDPWAGGNSSDASLDGNFGRYVAWSETGSGDSGAQTQFVLLQMPFEIHGAIRDHWVATGGVTGFLGVPTTNETGTPDGVGRFNHFNGASIYWTPSTGAHDIRGLIRDKWASLGWETSFLGYPITDEMGSPDNVGRYSHFQKNGIDGAIYWTPAVGQPHEVHGDILAKWKDLGWETGQLGYPITDEMADPGVPGGRVSRFQHGSLHWTPDRRIVVGS